MYEDIRPTKRRRGLADSIVSTAWNAALYGSAVGLTVFKLLRNRGQEESQDSEESYRVRDAKMDNMDTDYPPESALDSPPPPYNQEWTAVNYLQPPSPLGLDKGKQRSTPRTERRIGHRSTTKRERPSNSRKGRTLPRSSLPRSSGPFLRPVVQPEFDFSAAPPVSERHDRSLSYTLDTSHDDDPEPDEQMDWIGGKLAQLIEEGKKALGKEVVVMSEAKEDEVDDGSGAWVSDDEERERTGFKRRGSTRSRRSTITGGGYIPAPFPSTSSDPMSYSPATPHRNQRHGRGLSHDGMGSPDKSISRHDDDEFQSPEVREMMERARAKLSARLAR